MNFILTKIKKERNPSSGPLPPQAYLEDTSNTTSIGGLELNV